MAVILALGDSITYGLWDRQGGWLRRLREFLDKRSLERQRGPNLNTEHYLAVYNLGIPGDTTAGAAKRFDEDVIPRLNSEQKTVIIFAIGINDSRFLPEQRRHSVSLEDFLANLTLLLNKARKITNEIFFVGFTPVDEARTDPILWRNTVIYRNEYIRNYNAKLTDFCRSYSVEYIEVFDEFYKPGYENLLEDGLHPNDKGHQLLEDIIREHLLRKGAI